jgi:hypothetical protein
MKQTGLLIVLMLACLLPMAGCDNSPGSIRDYVIVSNGVAGAADGGTELFQTGVIDANQAKSFAKRLDDADSILKVWRTVIDSNGVSPELSRQAHTIIDKLIDEQIAAIKRQREAK